MTSTALAAPPATLRRAVDADIDYEKRLTSLGDDQTRPSKGDRA
jgi:hypothetical protein